VIINFENWTGDEESIEEEIERVKREDKQNG